MTFGRWLLIHSFSIFLVIMLILGYVYREELQLEQAYQQLLNIEPAKLSVQETPSEPEPEPAKTTAIPELTPQPTFVPKAEEPTLTAEKPVASEITGKAIESESLPTLPQPGSDLDDSLLLARKAYWDKNYSESIRLYQRLIEQDDKNADYFGELGNIYYSLNDDQNASRAFYRAAMILIEQNQPQDAARLLSPIKAMNRGLGDQLERQLRQSSANQP